MKSKLKATLIPSLVIQKWQQLPEFANHMSWLALSQICNKVIRLFATILVARYLMAEEFGLIAIIFTTHEIITSLLKRGTQTQIINCQNIELPSVVRQAIPINYGLCFSAFVLQSMLAYALAQVYSNQSLVVPLMLLATIHLQLPLAMHHAAINIRQSKLKLVAQIDVTQTALDALLTLLLISLDFGIWALILPKILVVPVWILRHRQNCQRIDLSLKTDSIKTKLLGSSILVTITDAMCVIRSHIDYLIIGYFIGVEALGVYYFAYNAGLGIANSVIGAANASLLPHFSRSRREDINIQPTLLKSLKVVILVMVILIGLQTSLASLYVPIIFGQKWIDAGALPILIALCVTALPRVIIEITSQLLRAGDLLLRDLIGNTLITLTIGFAIIVAVNQGLLAVAIAIGIALCVAMLLFFYTSYQAMFNKDLEPCDRQSFQKVPSSATQ